MRKLIFIIIITGIALGLAGFWYWQKNPFSKEVLKLEIIGPDKAAVFEEIEYTVKYKNNGDVRLKEPRLVFEFPENTLLEEDISKRQEIDSKELGGDIYPGEEKTFKFKGRLFGKEDDIKTAKAWVYFKLEDLKAPYESATEINTVLESVPLSFDFDLPSKAERGREFNIFINYFSSLNYPIANLGVRIEYPDSFEFLSSFPESLSDNEWELPVLNKAEGGRIEIEGRLLAELNEQKLFKAVLGLWKDDEFIPLKEAARSVEITKPQLFIFQKVNGSETYAAAPGESLHYEIFFRNISDDPFTDLFLAVTFESRAFDFNTIKADAAKFKQGDNSIIWDWRDVAKLRYLKQGEEGKVDFWIDLKSDGIGELQSVVLKNTVLISHVKEEFEIKLSSKLEISQFVYFNDEVFGNSGPIPPKAGQATTYTITWQAKNYSNEVKNVKVKAVLPSNVELTGKIFPDEQTSRFTFDKISREIIWRIGDMETGTGIAGVAPIISFQVSLTPTSSQIGGTALIIGEAEISGDDQWTDKTTKSTAPAVDTSLPDDASIGNGQGIVK